MMTFIALGNTGEKYKNTRHNVATLIACELVKEWTENKYAYADIGNMTIGEKEVNLIKPNLFMNESGKVIPFLIKNFSNNTEDIVVIHDDIDLPLGTIRISYDRGDGGHNGVKSIMQALDSKEFIRIRVGVSIIDENDILRKPDVLGNFNQNELDKIQKEITPKVNEIIVSLVKDGKEKAMNTYN